MKKFVQKTFGIGTWNFKIENSLIWNGYILQKVVFYRFKLSNIQFTWKRDPLKKQWTPSRRSVFPLVHRDNTLDVQQRCPQHPAGIHWNWDIVSRSIGVYSNEANAKPIANVMQIFQGTPVDIQKHEHWKCHLYIHVFICMRVREHVLFSEKIRCVTYLVWLWTVELFQNNFIVSMIPIPLFR